MPALASTRFSMLFTLSGEMGALLGEGEQADCRLWREEGGERVAAVGVQRSCAVSKAHTGHRNRRTSSRRHRG